MFKSSLANTNSTTKDLKGLSVGQSYLVELKSGVDFNRYMKSVTALCVRLDIKVSQKSLKGIGLDFDDENNLNIVKVIRLS